MNPEIELPYVTDMPQRNKDPNGYSDSGLKTEKVSIWAIVTLSDYFQ